MKCRALIAVYLILLASACQKSPVAPTGSVTTTLSTLDIQGSTQIVSKGQKSSLKLVATLSDMSTKDVSADAVWTSSNTAIATVDKGTVTAFDYGSTQITASYESHSKAVSVKVVLPPPSRVDFTIGTSTSITGINKTLQLDAKATYPEGTVLDVTSQTTWNTLDFTVLSVSTTGLLTTRGLGQGTVTLTFQGLHADLRVTVLEELLSGPGTPALSLTFVPAKGSKDLLRGQVFHVFASKCRVEVYIQVDGNWWSKPTFLSPLSPVFTDGTFAVNIVTGGDDDQATQIYAFLVTADHTPVLASGASRVPLSVNGQDVLAVTSVGR